jgi:hypothetical protein
MGRKSSGVGDRSEGGIVEVESTAGVSKNDVWSRLN